MTSKTLTPSETALWESGGAHGQDFRSAVRGSFRGAGDHVEVYSYDGIVLDAWDN